MSKVTPESASLICTEFRLLMNRLMSVLKASNEGESVSRVKCCTQCFAKSLLSTIKHSRLMALIARGINIGFVVLIMFVLTVLDSPGRNHSKLFMSLVLSLLFMQREQLTYLGEMVDSSHTLGPKMIAPVHGPTG